MQIRITIYVDKKCSFLNYFPSLKIQILFYQLNAKEYFGSNYSKVIKINPRMHIIVESGFVKKFINITNIA